jgi:hypothetical protein
MADEQLLGEPDISTGTRISQYTVVLYELYVKNEELTMTKQNNIMVLGLSSILNASSNSDDTQKILFSDEEWISIKFYNTAEETD